MDTPSIRPTAAFNIFVFLIVGVIAALITHLALVTDVEFLKDIKTDLLIIFIIIAISHFVPKRLKIVFGEAVTPALKLITVSRSKKGNFEALEQTVEGQRLLRIEQDKKIKANPFLYFLTVTLIILLILGFVCLMVFLVQTR